VRPVFLAGLVVLGLSFTPWAIASAYPPAGTAFLGTFYYVDDFFNYLSYAQQAEDGAFVFINKAILTDHPPALVNLEWWLVGGLSRLMGGGHLLLAYRLFGLLAASGFLLVADRWLQRLGLGEGDRLPALLLVALGGGLGGVLFKEGLGPLVLPFAGRGLTECLDLFTGFFPFVRISRQGPPCCCWASCSTTRPRGFWASPSRPWSPWPSPSFDRTTSSCSC
jgi:hypothetical protein